MGRPLLRPLFSLFEPVRHAIIIASDVAIPATRFLSLSGRFGVARHAGDDRLAGSLRRGDNLADHRHRP
jgi:hypothetical protein